MIQCFFILILAIARSPQTEPIEVRDNHWAWQSATNPTLPEVRDEEWCRNEIDRFILARMESEGLTPASEADRQSLLRRASFDLTGLPPTQEEQDRFLTDPSPDAYEQLIDRLLDSPHYGERWARHWLDLVRYAETNGFERDGMKPEVWRYRDWVIESLNVDMPYDQFILEQIAGDELPDRTARTVAATGMHRLGLWDDEPTDVPQAIADDLDSIVDTTIRATLGISIGCARCHDHKGDPISQVDYYRLTAFFSGVTPYRNPTGGTHIEERHILRSMPRDDDAEPQQDLLERHHAERTALIDRIRRQEERSSVPIDTVSDGLVAHYTMEMTEEGQARDSIGASHGTLVGSPQSVEGVSGNALRFGPDTGHIEIKRLISDDFTISLFFRSDAIARGSNADPRWFMGSGLVDAEITGVVRDFGISLIGDGIVAAGLGAPERFTSTPPGFNDGAWHHVALVRDRKSGEFALYVDGILAQKNTGNHDPLDSQSTLYIGASRPGHGPFKGAIDEVSFFDQALNGDEILALAFGVSPTPAETSMGIPGGESTYLSDRRQLRELSIPRVETVRLLSLSESGPQPPVTRVLGRGSVHAPGEIVQPGVPEVVRHLAPVPESMPTEQGDSSGRRTALAMWINDPGNSVALRTAVNRIWHHHFGLGIVPSTNDFGRLGLPPSHPKLLDWLAGKFLQQGRSLKAMHRLMMTSSTYRMSSIPAHDALERDPENRFLSRFRMRRLGAEELRDAMLAVSGELQNTLGGPSVRPPLPDSVLETSSRPNEVWPVTSTDDVGRRSIYIHTKRSLLDPLLTVFDLADPDSPCPERYATTQPTQCLTLLNSDFSNDRAGALAQRLMDEHPHDLDAQIRRAIALSTNRPATAQEIEEARDFIELLKRDEGFQNLESLQTFCLLALNLNEFIYVD